MRKLLIALSALAVVGFALPVTSSANAETKKIIIKRGHHDHGMHRGWHEGRHRGWDRDRHHGKKVVIIKKRGHRHHD